MEEIRKQVRTRIMRTRMNEKMKLAFIDLFNTVGLSEKKMNTFVKIDNVNVQIGFLFRFLISSAYKYGVPNIYIKECIDFKKSYIKEKFKLKSKPKRKFFGFDELGEYNDDNLYKIRMEGAYTKLLYATIEMAKIKTSRKEKISMVLERIADKSNIVS